MENHRLIKVGKIVLFFIILGLIYYFIVNSSFVSQFESIDSLKQFIIGFGISAPIILIIIQALQNIIPIVPTEIVSLVAGFVFGAALGSFYSLLGCLLGSAMVFIIARKYGKGLAEKLFDKKEVVHFNLFFKKNKMWAIFIARIAPLFPNDLVSFSAGLTDIKFGAFNLSSTLGFVFETVIMTYLGAQLSVGITATPLIVFGLFIGASVLIMLFRQKLKHLLIKDIHRLEKEERVVEKEIEKEFRKI